MQQLWDMFGQTGLEDSGKCSVLVGGPAGRSRNLSKRHLGLWSERGNHYKEDRKRDPEEARIRKEERKSVWGGETKKKKAQADKKNETKFQTGKTAGTFITVKLSKSREMKTGDNSDVTAELLRRRFRHVFAVKSTEFSGHQRHWRKMQTTGNVWVKSMKINLKLDLCLQSFLEVTLQSSVLDPCLEELLLWVNVGWELWVVTQISVVKEPSPGPRIRNDSSVLVATI